MTTPTLRKQASNFALAIALATGGALVASIAAPDAAFAQKKKKKKEEKASYSEEFIAAYQPLNEALGAEGADTAALRPQVDALISVSASPDEKIATGGLVYNYGVKTQDQATQLQGLEMMLDSGKLPEADLGRFNFIAYQLANALQDYSKSRGYLQTAIDLNYNTDAISLSDLRIAMAESYFAANELQQGYDYLTDAIATQKSSGAAVDEAWYRRGISVAYENESIPEVYDFATAWIADYPSEQNWRDAVGLARNLNVFEDAPMLDLLRLSRKVGALDTKQDYIFYVEAADPRRLPKEVKDVIEEGYSAGTIAPTDSYLAEALTMAKGRIASDRSDLPALERDALAADAGLRTVMAAGAAFLSYDEYQKAVTFYEKALGMPGVDRNEALTRLGIAQVGLGDYAAADETFAQVSGERLPVARLWSAYVDLQSQNAMSPSAPATAQMGEQTGA